MAEPRVDQDGADSAPQAVAFIAVLVVAAVLRLWGLHELPLNPDEVWEVTHNSASLSEQVRRVEGFPPLHGWTLGVLLELTGRDEVARLFSAVLGVATVALSAWIGRLAGGPTVAWWSCVLIAVSPYHIALSRSGRPYSLYVLVAALAIAAGLRLRGKSLPGAWVAFGVACWAVVATSYLGGVLVGMLVALVAVECVRDAPRKLSGFLAGLTLACLPLTVCLWIDLNGVEEDFFHRVVFDKEAYAFTYLELLTGAAVGPSVDELSDLPSAEGIRAVAPWAIAAFLPAAALATIACRRMPRRSLRWLLVLVVGAPLAIGGLSSLMPTGYGIRYFAWIIVPGVLLLASGAACSTDKPLASLATAGLIGVNLLGVYNRSHDPRYTSYDFRRVEAVVEEGFGDTPVLSAPPYLAAAVRYNLQTEERPVFDAFSTTLLDARNEHADWRVALQRMDEALGDRESFALVVQATAYNDERSPTLQRYAELLRGELVATPSPRVAIYRITRGALRDAIAELAEFVGDPPD